MDVLNRLGISEHVSGTCYALGQWDRDSSTKALVSTNPNDGSTLAKVSTCTSTTYEALMENATAAFLEWRSVPAPKRGELIWAIGQALREKKDELGSLVALEMGKSKAEGDGEVQEMIDMADFAVGQSRMLYGNTMHSERPMHRMYEQWHPLGVVGVISAFNFPVAVWAWNAFISAICGNTVVWKPSSKTPLCAVAVQMICNEVMKAQGTPHVFSMFVPENHDLAEQFVKDPRVALVSFTGSSHTGRHVGEVVAQRMGRSLLELGGNNAIILDESANLKMAIPAIVFGAVGTAGQRCTSTRRLFVHRSQAHEVIDKLVHAYEQLQIGSPLDPNNHMGPLIDEGAVTQFEEAVAKAKAQGGKLYFGGERLDRAGHFVKPTIIGAQNEWDIVQQETFAPILYVIEYSDFNEALSQQNAVPQGLSSALFTDTLQNAELFLSAMGSDCGIANINIGTSGAEIGGAFGGEKETGGGREAGSDAWKAYMRRQTNTINWGDSLPLAQGIKFDLKS